MKYIFVTGAPGSKWSSVVKHIYFSDSIDHSDYIEERVYKHAATGKMEVMHTGAYFDPGMEFGKFFNELNYYDKDECELEFDRPFTGNGIRIIKSHHFAYHIEFLKENWPDCPIVLVHRDNDACLGWWVRCGHFNIKYPNYTYYQDLSHMANHIDNQNREIKTSMKCGVTVPDNLTLCDLLKIKPPADTFQQYNLEDINVSLL